MGFSHYPVSSIGLRLPDLTRFSERRITWSFNVRAIVAVPIIISILLKSETHVIYRNIESALTKVTDR